MANAPSLFVHGRLGRGLIHLLFFTGSLSVSNPIGLDLTWTQTVLYLVGATGWLKPSLYTRPLQTPLTVNLVVGWLRKRT